MHHNRPLILTILVSTAAISLSMVHPAKQFETKSGLPGFFVEFLINGQVISGAQPFASFEQAIEAKLKK